jgi:hypothetical protein
MSPTTKAAILMLALRFGLRRSGRSPGACRDVLFAATATGYILADIAFEEHDPIHSLATPTPLTGPAFPR